MNTFNNIILIAVPIIVIGYIVWDLFSHKFTAKLTKMSYSKTAKFAEVSYDKEIDKINWENMRNTGVRLPEDEIPAITQKDVVTYKDIF